MRRIEGIEALLAAQKARGLVALAGTDSSDSMRDRHVAMEVAQVRRVGEGAASSAIATARALHVEFPQFLAALTAGEVSEWHCRILVAETAHVTDAQTLAALQARLLPKAVRRTPSEFRREVRRAVADLDAAREAERHALARADRYVSCTPLPDGMGHLGIVSDWPTISAMHAAGPRRGPRPSARRAVARRLPVAGTTTRSPPRAARTRSPPASSAAQQADGSMVLDPTDVPVSLTLVMDLDTLRGEADRHALLDGEPIPAEVARDYADAASLWRRAVTDPVTGHLLDYGREQYLPATLRDYVLARDHCRVPGCTTRAVSRLEMDHADPVPRRRHLQRPTAAGCAPSTTSSRPHASPTSSTPRPTAPPPGSPHGGSGITIPPRPYLHDPRSHQRAAGSRDARPPDPSPPPAFTSHREPSGSGPRERHVPDPPPF